MATIKRILVPTDFSENATSVFDFVKETAQNYNATVDLIHVIPRLSYLKVSRDTLGNPFEDKNKYARLRDELKIKLDNELKEHVPEENRGRTFVKHEDKPGSGIVKHAQSGERYDLIMISSRGRGNSVFKRGSVTEKLIRLASTPVLSVNKGYDHEIKTVLVPTDGSKVSLEALPMALLIAEQNNAAITLYSVSEHEGGLVRATGKQPYRFTIDQIKDAIYKGLREYVKDGKNVLSFISELSPGSEVIKLKNGDRQAIELAIVVERGPSAHAAIVGFALENAQVVVMGTHGRSGMANLFVGSTTEKVARQLKLPVLTIKPKFTRRK